MSLSSLDGKEMAQGEPTEKSLIGANEETVTNKEL